MTTLTDLIKRHAGRAGGLDPVACAVILAEETEKPSAAYELDDVIKLLHGVHISLGRKTKTLRRDATQSGPRFEWVSRTSGNFIWLRDFAKELAKIVGSPELTAEVMQGAGVPNPLVIGAFCLPRTDKWLIAEPWED